MQTDAADERWMRLALSLGARALGQTAPNPAVGCVIVQGDVPVGRGWTQPTGRPHAEVVALRQAGPNANGATAYVTLEPCAHHGKTGPCAQALIDARVARVVIAVTDPDPRVAGKGIAMLQAAGIQVDKGCLRTQATAAHQGFFTRVTHGRPMVTLKLASSLDGKIATRTGDSQWITNPASRAHVHMMRATHDAIMVGRRTAELDNPDLRVRLAGMTDRSPTRAVLDSQLSLPTDLAMLSSAKETPVLMCHTSGADTSDWARTDASLIACKANADGRLDIADCLHQLGTHGINRLLCEGGGTLAASLLSAGLVDQLITFHAGTVIGADGLASMASLGLTELISAPRFTLADQRVIKGDVMCTWVPIP